MNSTLNKIMGIIFIFVSLFIPVMMVLVNKEVLLDYNIGFAMGATMIAGIMILNG